MTAVLRSPPDNDVSIGRIFALALATIRRNVFVMLLLALTFGAAPQLLIARYYGQLMDAQGSDLGLQTWLLYGLGTIVTTAIAILPQAVLTRAVIAESEGRRASLVESIKAGAAVLLPIIALGIATALMIVAGLALLLIPGVMMMTAWAVAAPAMVGERRSIEGALLRSQQLTRGHRWKVLGLLLIFYAFYFAQQAGLELISGEWDSETLSAAYANPTYLLIAAINETLISLFWCPVMAALYVELRNAKDGPAAENLAEIFS